MFRRLTLIAVLWLNCCAVTLAQCPPNIGFEAGNFNNWQCAIGEVRKDGSVFLIDSPQPIEGRQTLYKKGDQTLDKYGHFPVVCPNGSGYSVKLGNDNTHHEAERISYTYKVPPGQNMTLVLNYAVVLADPSLAEHTYTDLPRFTAKVYDVTDDVPIYCPAFDFIPMSGIGFSKSDTFSPRAEFAILYRAWSATTINLEGYGGKTIKLEFTTNDCTFEAHFGYAYLDIEENCNAAISGNTYCLGQTEATLRGPAGFANYRWFKGIDTTGTPLSKERNLKVSAPVDNDVYTVVFDPYYGLGCSGVLHTRLQQLATPFEFKLKPEIVGCAGVGINLQDPAIKEGSSPGLTYSYHTNATTLDYLYSPDNVTKPGTYYIKAVNDGGCTDIKPIEIKFNPLPVVGSEFTTKTVQYPASADITVPNTSSVTYAYFKDAAAKVPLDNYSTISTGGTYYIVGSNAITGCSSLAIPVKVIISPPDEFKLNIPTAFTPNNDGVNDMLDVSIKGFLSFGNIKIYNRYGLLLYTTNQQAQSWTGTFKGKQLPVGTYYWVFEGTDTYYKTPVRKSGAVAIIR